MRRKKNLPDFWFFVDKTPGHGPKGDCWVWTGYRNPHGYGVFQRDGRKTLAHRFVLSDPSDNVLHRCDNPPCVRPEHLFCGTHTENVRDMWEKGRGWSPFLQLQKLSDVDIAKIKCLYQTGDYYQYEIAAMFNVSRSMISRVVRGNRRKRL